MLADPSTLHAEYVSQSSRLYPALLTTYEFRDVMMKRDVIMRHMDVYMEHLYYVPSLGFLHPPTFYRQIQVKQASHC